MRFLIVDDQPRARQSMKALLGAWHQTDKVFEAVDGAEAVRLAEEVQPDVIIIDARMPVMSGLEAIRIIHAKSPHIKLIVLSMYADVQNEALEAGADAFVCKSDPPRVLRAALVQVMRGV